VCVLHLPCFESSAEYRAEISFYIGFIENMLNTESYSEVIILDDTNFKLSDSSTGFALFKSLLLRYNVIACDDVIRGPDRYTYVNTALGHSSCIDHFFVSSNLYACVQSVAIVDSGINSSDHRPITMCLALPHSVKSPTLKCNKHIAVKVQWDKGSLPECYRLTNEALNALNLIVLVYFVRLAVVIQLIYGVLMTITMALCRH
jgi:hypothetical protein